MASKTPKPWESPWDRSGLQDLEGLAEIWEDLEGYWKIWRDPERDLERGTPVGRTAFHRQGVLTPAARLSKRIPAGRTAFHQQKGQRTEGHLSVGRISTGRV